MNAPALASLVLLTSLSTVPVLAQDAVIRGTFSAEEPVADGALVRVFAMRLHVRADGRAVRPSKQEVFLRSVRGDASGVDGDGGFRIAVEPGFYCVFGFADLDRDGRWDPGIPEPFGWCTDQPAGSWDPIEVTAAGCDVTFSLRAPEHFPKESRRVEHGALLWVKGYPVLQLSGDAAQRGFAHGSLIARQIVDFFRCYILEDKMSSAKDYAEGFARFLETHMTIPEAMRIECDAVIAGMQSSGVDLHIPELGRAFSRTDLLAISAYIETRAMRASCTQFAAWGQRTEGTDVDGGMVTGRNMDGECDLRKVTVSHFLMFAVDPSEPGQQRYVSMMWPGFVGTISGLNESGFYTMENAGGTGPGPVVDRIVPISWTMRESLARLDGTATPESVKALCDEYANAAGGCCGPGCIMLFAVPFTGQSHPAFVFEGDRFGDAIRLPGEVRPWLSDAIVCSNHFHRYGRDPDAPGTFFGRTPGFSSQWRYEAGMHKLEAWSRIDRKIGTADMRELLQTVAHGTTEYAVITRPNALEFDVAVASMDAELWDAPYRAWTTYRFDEVFPRPRTDGYRGIWYGNQKSGDEYVYKYSGGLGTYCAKHNPFAVYCAAVDKTFFCYGGATDANPRELLHMVSYFDHKTGQVPRPAILLDKHTGDAHDNPVISVDDAGHVWIFSTSHGRARPSFVHRSVEPYSIDTFERVDATYETDAGDRAPLDNFSYMQAWHVPGQGFVAFFTRYDDPAARTNMFMTSSDGVRWSRWQRLAAIDEGHYQISAVAGGVAATAFNYHPAGKGLNWRTNLYYLATNDLGATWCTVDGRTLEIPITNVDSAALVHDYAAEGLNVYLKDITFDSRGHPVLMYITSGGYEAGPDNAPRTWTTARWTGQAWAIHPITTSDNNYDMGSLLLESDTHWRLIAPTEPGPQRFNPGGEVAMWETRDAGVTWARTAMLTSGSEHNHTYVRRPVAAHPGFQALWADGHGRQPSASRLYLGGRDGRVFRLPARMDGEFAVPTALPAVPAARAAR